MNPAGLDSCIDQIEQALQALASALLAPESDYARVPAAAAALQRALAVAAARQPQAPATQPPPAAARSRLLGARARFAAQREALARATAALDRAAAVLLPPGGGDVGYDADGLAGRRAGSGFARA